MSASSPVAATSALDRIFGMDTVQRTQCLTGAPDERLRHSRTFQVRCSKRVHDVRSSIHQQQQGLDSHALSSACAVGRAAVPSCVG